MNVSTWEVLVAKKFINWDFKKSGKDNGDKYYHNKLYTWVNDQHNVEDNIMNLRIKELLEV